MANTESPHDLAVDAVKEIYEKYGKNVWINPGSEKNKTWCGQYIDIIATETKDSEKAWVIEIETEESVSSTEAKNQWAKYDKAYTTIWYLAVPLGSTEVAEKLIEENNIENCKVISWSRNDDGVFNFLGLPGL